MADLNTVYAKLPVNSSTLNSTIAGTLEEIINGLYDVVGLRHNKIGEIEVITDTAANRALATPAEGNLWGETDTGKFFLYMNAAWREIPVDAISTGVGHTAAVFGTSTVGAFLTALDALFTAGPKFKAEEVQYTYAPVDSILGGTDDVKDGLELLADAIRAIDDTSIQCTTYGGGVTLKAAMTALQSHVTAITTGTAGAAAVTFADAATLFPAAGGTVQDALIQVCNTDGSKIKYGGTSTVKAALDTLLAREHGLVTVDANYIQVSVAAAPNWDDVIQYYIVPVNGFITSMYAWRSNTAVGQTIKVTNNDTTLFYDTSFVGANATVSNSIDTLTVTAGDTIAVEWQDITFSAVAMYVSVTLKIEQA